MSLRPVGSQCHALDAVGRCHHAVQAAVVGDPLRRRLRAHLLDTRHVVHGVADQRQVIDDALGRHTELGRHAGDVQLLGRLGHGVHQRHTLGHQLRQVLVAGADEHLVAAGRGHAGQRADGVVGLDARHLQHRPAHQAHDLVDGFDLLAQRVGHGRTLGLVVGVPVVAEGLALGVEHADSVLGGVAVAQPAHHGHETVDGAGGEAVGAAQVGQGVVGPVEVARTIHQQHQLFTHAGHCGVVPRPAARRHGRCVE